MISGVHDNQSSPAVAPPLAWLLRLEGLAIASLAAILYGLTGAGWTLFACLWLIPDVSAVAYLAGPRWGARCYNAAHTYIGAATLAAASLLLHQPALLPFALIWFNHIGVDRVLGYGLKYSNGFGWTHLKKLGKKADSRL